MKTKLLFCKIQMRKNHIFSLLIILFMTVSSFGQLDGIDFECEGAGLITFGIPDGTFNGKTSWSNGVDFNGTPSYTLRFENDNTWSVRDPNGPRFFFTSVDINGLPSCNSTDWERDLGANGAFCNGVIVTCVTPSDPDNDGDGFPASVDCNDNDPSVNTEITYYLDSDGDGFGTTPAGFCSSTAPSGYAAADGDCNDGDAAVNPGATEVCDGIDNNCDGNIDEGLIFTTYYLDADGDLYGDPASTISTCDGVPAGYVTDNTDCNDSEFLANPGLVEIPFDTIDNDCDGEIDEDDNPPVVYEYCDSKQKKVLICHNGKTKCVSINAVDAHLAHGDYLGSCDNGREGEILTEERPTSYDLVSRPNPTNDLFNVRMVTPNYEDEVNLQAFDINGRLIYTDKIKGNEDYQFGYNLQAGIYFVKVTQGETTQVIKVMKR